MSVVAQAEARHLLKLSWRLGRMFPPAPPSTLSKEADEMNLEPIIKESTHPFLVGQAFVIVRILQAKHDIPWYRLLVHHQFRQMLKDDVQSFNRMEDREADKDVH